MLCHNGECGSPSTVVDVVHMIYDNSLTDTTPQLPLIYTYRGVPYFRLNIPVQSPKRKAEGWEGVWKCPSQGVPWMCTTSHHHRWTNTPLVLDCQWFLR